VNPDVDTEGWFAPVTVIRTNLSERPFIVDSIREFLHSEDSGHRALHLSGPPGGAGRRGGVLSIRPPGRGGPGSRWSTARSPGSPGRSAWRSSGPRSPGASRTWSGPPTTSGHAPEGEDTVAYLDRVAETLPGPGRRGGRGPGLPRVAPGPAGSSSWGTGPTTWWSRGGGLGPGGAGLGAGDPPREEASSYSRPVPLETLPETAAADGGGGPLLIISKTNALSTVHRRARMDYIGVKKLDAEGPGHRGAPVPGALHLRAYSEKADRIPILRQKLAGSWRTRGGRKGPTTTRRSTRSSTPSRRRSSSSPRRRRSGPTSAPSSPPSTPTTSGSPSAGTPCSGASR
jgi:hypothetical protein